MAQGSINIIETDSGGFNVVGISNGVFILEGHLSLVELEMLHKIVGAVLDDKLQKLPPGELDPRD